MNRSVRSVSMLVFTMLTLSMLFSSVSAASVYYYRWSTAPAYTCAPYMSGVAVTLANQPVEWDLPAGAEFSYNYRKNGVDDFVGPFAAPVGTGSFVYGSFLEDFTGYPLTFEFSLLTHINGEIVYSSTLIVNCSGDSTGTPTLVNVAFPGSSNGGTQFTDGRINPQNYAPVVLYCDDSTLNAFSVDGAPLWQSVLDGDSPAENDLLTSEGDAFLLQYPDGRYGVQATQPDGKLYLFVFDGCPSVGTFEVYVTDPTTGGLIRTE